MIEWCILYLLTVKVLITIAGDGILPSRWFTWNAKSYFFPKKLMKKIKMSAAVVISTLWLKVHVHRYTFQGNKCFEIVLPALGATSILSEYSGTWVTCHLSTTATSVTTTSDFPKYHLTIYQTSLQQPLFWFPSAVLLYTTATSLLQPSHYNSHFSDFPKYHHTKYQTFL